MERWLIVVPMLAVLAACGSSSDDAKAKSASSSTAAPASSTTTIAVQAPPPPTNPSTLETSTAGLGVTPKVLFDQTGSGSGSSGDYGPPSDPNTPKVNVILRTRVEWACAPGGSVEARVIDSTGQDISLNLENGFDGVIPTDTHRSPVHVEWKVSGACSWHVRVLDQNI